MFRRGRGAIAHRRRQRVEREFSPLINDENNFFFMHNGDEYKYNGF